ncbi:MULTISPECIES: hypothetical protein [Streptomyces]|uniref:hypothetical protein n=1 Tax=Streptomyces TaxID=1883 RepID=UPI000BB0F227|nr:hypothetical protein [Streptomyces sp. Ag82_O1-15]PBC93691.1 hypothetical protein BX281_1529 [Streptomyces sp. Ag82_O1-15]
MSSPQPMPPTPQGPEPFMTMHTAIVLLSAAFIGLIAGGLTFLSTEAVPGALLAGLSAFGVSVPVLRQLIH